MLRSLARSTPTPGRRPVTALLALLAAGACTPADPGPPPAPPLPEGTVLTVDGVPVTAAEVDRWADVTARLEPHEVRTSWRRKALANIVLPMRCAEALDPAGREDAFRDAQRLHGAALELDRLPDDARWTDHAEGSWDAVGLVDWAVAEELAVGEWSPLYETIGGWAFFRLLERPEEWTPTCSVRLERVHVFYLDPEGLEVLVEDALLHLPKEVIDLEWEACIPPLYLQGAAARGAE